MDYRIADITKKIIIELYNDDSQNKAILANLRVATSIEDKHAEQAWPLMFKYMTDKDLSIDGHPSYAENAIFTALRCYAILQQGQEKIVFVSKSKDKKDDEGIEFFEALNQIRDINTQNSLDRRVNAVLSTTNITNATNLIVQLEKLLKSKKKENIQIDFAKLAQDLFFFQVGYDQARKTSLIWGQQYYKKVYALEKD